MIAFNNGSQTNASDWQTAFVEMLPEIKKWLRLAFCRLASEAREDAIAEGIAHCLLAYVRLHEQGRAEVATASSLAWYSSRQVRRGRPAVGRMNSKEPLSRYARVGSGNRFARNNGEWIDTLAEDKHASVPDLVAAKLDVRAWFATLTQRMKEIAKDLACGYSTSEVARKYGVTAGRVSQLRRSLEESWGAFQQEAVVMA
jgi:DNA-binding NarL/FixJ family response regulator